MVIDMAKIIDWPFSGYAKEMFATKSSFSMVQWMFRPFSRMKICPRAQLSAL